MDSSSYVLQLHSKIYPTMNVSNLLHLKILPFKGKSQGQNTVYSFLKVTHMECLPLREVVAVFACYSLKRIVMKLYIYIFFYFLNLMTLVIE